MDIKAKDLIKEFASLEDNDYTQEEVEQVVNLVFKGTWKVMDNTDIAEVRIPHLGLFRAYSDRRNKLISAQRQAKKMLSGDR